MPLAAIVHLVPVSDLIEHDVDDEQFCVCGPGSEWLIADDGSHGKIIVHHALDGRDLRERDRGSAH